ncbi:MFSD12 isoform 12, partial [Pongo abelii]
TSPRRQGLMGHRLRPALLPLHLQPLPGLWGGHAGVGCPPLLRPVHRDLPVWLGLHTDLPPQPHPGARHQRA